MPELVVASFNTHAGMDGWGKRYDLTEACQLLKADVIVLQEIFAPLEAASQADEIAADLGYTSIELPFARAWRRTEALTAGRGWEPRKLLPVQSRALRVGGRVDLKSSDLTGYEEGTWGLAVLSRYPIVRSEALELGKLKRDFTHRGALLVELATKPAPSPIHDPPHPEPPADPDQQPNFTLVGMHAAHLSAGSPLHFRHLRSELPSKKTPGALAGDMNLWGPPLSLMLPGWSRAVKGRTWPAWRPHSQLDHILVTPVVTVTESRVMKVGNSDHLAVQAHLHW